MNHPMSKSQARLMTLANIEHPNDEWTTYGQAASALREANLPEDGLPSGHSWRSAAKLADADLLAACVATIREQREAQAVESLHQAYGE